jgi:hypothetical protein
MIKSLSCVYPIFVVCRRCTTNMGPPVVVLVRTLASPCMHGGACIQGRSYAKTMCGWLEWLRRRRASGRPAGVVGEQALRQGGQPKQRRGPGGGRKEAHGRWEEEDT